MRSILLPCDKRAIWLLNAAVVIGLPVTNWIYWPAVLEANVLPPEADNVMIAMMGSIILAVLLAPIIAVLTWASLRKPRKNIDLAAWDAERPIVSGLVSLLFLGLFALGARSLLAGMTAPSGWPDEYWIPYALLFMAWSLTMRGLILSPPLSRHS